MSENISIYLPGKRLPDFPESYDAWGPEEYRQFVASEEGACVEVCRELRLGDWTVDRAVFDDILDTFSEGLTDTKIGMDQVGECVAFSVLGCRALLPEEIQELQAELAREASRR